MLLLQRRRRRRVWGRRNGRTGHAGPFHRHVHPLPPRGHRSVSSSDRLMRTPVGRAPAGLRNWRVLLMLLLSWLDYLSSIRCGTGTT